MEKDLKIGQTIMCVKTIPLKGNDKAPDLEMGKEYTLQQIVYDRNQNPHFDVGVRSNVAYVTSWETQEELPDGDIIHWCHPSRFVEI